MLLTLFITNDRNPKHKEVHEIRDSTVL